MEYFCRYGWLGLLVIIVALVFLYRLLFDGLANFGITITFLLAGEIYLLGVARRFNRAVAEVRDGKAVSFNAAWNKRKLWRAVGMFTLECIDGDFWRLCINPPPVSLWKPWTPYSAVDIEFKCTTARANELRELMREWKREADQQHEAAEKIKLLTSIK